MDLRKPWHQVTNSGSLYVGPCCSKVSFTNYSVLSLSPFNLFPPVFYSLARLPSRNRLDGSLPGADARKASRISAGSASSTAPTSTCKKKSWPSTMQSRSNASKLASVSGNHSKPLFRTRKSCGGFSWVGCSSYGKMALELTPSTIIRKSCPKACPIAFHIVLHSDPSEE
jgi:hypothetical protein